jgi:hypothetical protein
VRGDSRRRRYSTTDRRLRRPQVERLEERTVPAVNTITNYNGLNFGVSSAIQQGAGATPPDPQGAVGPFSYVETVNLSVAIFDPKQSSPNPTTDALDDFFNIQGNLPDPNPNDFGNQFTDPVVLFDNLTQRFLVGCVEVDPGPQIEPGATGDNSSVFDVAVSKTSNPITLTTFDWNFYQINTTETNEFTDFPGNLGYNAGALIVTFNEFSLSNLQINHVLINAVNMSDLTNGVPAANVRIVQTDFAGSSLRPTTMHDSTSIDDPMWLIQEHPGAGGQGDGQQIDVVKMTHVLSNPPTFTTTTLAVKHYADVRTTPPLQPDNTVVTPEIDSRMQKVAEQNNLLVAAHSVSVSSTEDDAQWYAISVAGGTPVLKQQGDVSGGNHTYITYPAIDINPGGDIGMVYMQSGTDTPSDFLSVKVTGRKPSDPDGTMEVPAFAQAGLQVYQDFGPDNGATQRAGDLSGINIDSAGNFWAVSEFADDEPLPTPVMPSADWGTDIAEFTLEPLADLTVTATGPATVSPGGSASYDITLLCSGPDTAQQVVLSDVLPAGATNASITPVANPDGFTFTMANGVFTSNAVTVPNGNQDEFTITVSVSAGLALGTVFNDIASVTSATPDIDYPDNSATVIGSTGQAITIGANYNAINFGQAAALLGGAGSTPPDNQGAVGPSSFIEVINDAIGIFAPRTGAGTPVTDSLDDFFSVQGGLPDPNPNDPFGNFFTDPAIVFDEKTQRFIIETAEVDPGPQFLAQSTGDNSSVIDIAVSTSSNPTTITTSSWKFYQVVSTEPNEFADYPGNLGYNGGAFVVTLNEFETLDFNQTIDHVQVIAVNLSDLANGVPAASLRVFKSDYQGANLRPTTMHDSTSLDDPMWLVQEHLDASGNPDNQNIDVIKMTGVLSPTPTFTPYMLSVNPYAQVVQPLQPDDSGVTPALDSRIQKVAEQGGMLVAAHAVANAAGNQDLIQWYQIDVSSGTPMLHDQGDIGAGPNSYLYFPGIDINPAGDIGLSYLQSGDDNPNDFMSMVVTGRMPSDPAGTMEAPVVVQAGLQVYEDFAPSFESAQRAGDLSGINVASDGSFWAINEFADDEALPDPSNPSADWGTNVTQFTLPPTASKGDSASTVTSSLNPSVFGQSVTFTATVTAAAPGSGTPTGTVIFLDGAATLGSATLSSGSATLATSSLSAGNHTITVSYGGDANFNASTSAAITQTVNKSDSATTVTSSANPTVFGQAVTFTATVAASAPGAGTPGGMVTFNDGGVSFGSASLSGGSGSITASSLTVGNHTITVSYSGDTNFNASTSAAITQTVNKSDSATTVTSSANPTVFGQAVTFTATVSASAPGAGTPGGMATFNDGGVSFGSASLSGGSGSITTSSLAVGNHTITVSYSGDSNFNASTSSAITQTVNKSDSATTVMSSTNPTVFGQAVTFTATVSASGLGAGTPGGTVTFNDGGVSFGGASLTGGTANLTTSSLTVGNHTITVSYSGDNNFNASTSAAITQTVNKSDSATTVTSSANPTVFGQAVTFTAMVSASGLGAGTPGGTVTFNDGGVSFGSASLSGGTGSISTSSLTVGNHTITVSYSGDGNFNASTSAAITQTVNKSDSATTVMSSANPTVFGQAVTFTATVSESAPGAGTPGGTVTFNDGGVSFGSASLSGGSGNITTSSLGVGNHTITVSYSGDSNFNVSTSAAITQTVNKSDSATTVTSSANPTVSGQAVTFTATVSAVAPGAGAPGGTVQFVIDGGNFGSPVMVSGGSASITTAALSAGTHSISASYSGDGNFTGSTGSLSGGQTVDQAGTSTSISSSLNPSGFGQAVFFTAAVTSNSPSSATVTTGSVQFQIDGVNFGSPVNVTSSGMATSGSTKKLTVGTHTVTANYSGDANFAGSSASLSQTVAEASTTTSMSSSANPSLYGNSVTFTAQVTSSTATVNTGTVTFLDGTNTLGAVGVSATGTTMFSTGGLTSGVHSITANYSDGTTFASSSASLMQTVNQRQLFITANSTSKNEGDTLTFAGTEFTTSGLVNNDSVSSVTLTSDGATAAAEDGSYPITGSNAVGSGLSNYDIMYINGTLTVNETAVNGASATLAPVDEGGVAGGLQRPTEVATFSHANGVEPTTDFTVTINWGIAGHTADAGNVSQDSGGTYHVTALRPAFSEEGLYPVSVSISEDNASTSVSDTQEVDEPAINGTSATLAAVVVGQASATVEIATFAHANGVEPTTDFMATVNWGIAGHTADPGTVTVDGSGTYHVSAVRPVFDSAGTYSVSASITEDNAATSVTDSQEVDKADTSTKVTSSVNPSVFGQSVTFTAIVDPMLPGAGTPTGQVEFVLDGTRSQDAGLVQGAASITVSDLGMGTHTVTAMYLGDGNFNTSMGSLPGGQTVNRADTSTMVTSSVNPSVFGQAVTFTAIVDPMLPGAGTPTGTVTYFDGGVSIGASSLNGASPDMATFTTSALSTGTHSITAAYTSGDGNFNPSQPSAAITQTVNMAATTATLTSSPNPSVFGQDVTFTGVVSAVDPGAGTPTGQVTLTALDGTILGSATLSNGSATFHVRGKVPSYISSMNYRGDANFNGSASNAVTQTVNPADTTSTVASSVNPSVFGDSVTFTATVTANSPGSNAVANPTGTVTFYDDGASIGTGSLNGANTDTATFTTSALATGTHSITAAYSGDGNFNPSPQSAAITQTVNPSGTVGTTTTLASSANPSVVGQAITFTATVTPDSGSTTPTGTVTFTEGAATLGSASLSGGQATLTTSLLSSGLHVITATYGGSGEFGSSMSTALRQTVTPDGTTTSISSSANPSALGQPVTFTITVTPNAPGSGTPTGTVTLALPKAILGTVRLDGNGHATFMPSTMPNGSDPLTATYNGDNNFLTSSARIVQTVGAKASTATTLVSSLNPSSAGQAVTFTATVTGAGTTPTGTVTFIDAKITIGTATLDSNSVATFTTATLSIGTHHMFARYSGSSSYNTSSSNVVTQTVTAATTSTVLDSHVPVSRPMSLYNLVPLGLVVTVPVTSADGEQIHANAEAGRATQDELLSRLELLGASAIRSDSMELGRLLASPHQWAALDRAALDQFFGSF